MKKRAKRFLTLLMSGMMVMTMIPANMVSAAGTDAAPAKTVYVSKDAAGKNNGTSATDAFTSISAGVASLSPGDTLIIEAETYSEPLDFSNFGTGDSAVTTVKGEGGIVELTGVSDNISDQNWGDGYPHVLGVTNSFNIDISNIEFSYSPDAQAKYGSSAILVNSKKISLRHDIFNANANASSCIQPNSNCTITFDSNIIGGDCQRGIWTPWGMTGCAITNNIVKNTRGLDIACDAGHPDWQYGLSGNSICSNSFLGGMASTGESTEQFKNNTVANNIFGAGMTDVGSYVTNSGSGNVFAYNCYDVADSSASGKTLSATEFAADPLYKDAANGDYTLNTGSPCIETGSFDYLPAADFYGKTRTTADIGACSAAPKTADLAVTSATPSGGSAPVSGAITAALNDTVANTESNGLLTVKDGNGAAVDGTITVKSNKISFTPSGNLSYLTKYTATLSSAAAGINHGSLKSDYTWSFTTQAEPAAGTQYFVATNGDDKNPGTISQPKKTAGSLAGSLKPGDQVIFRSGIYDGIIVLQSKGSSAAGEQPIVFKSYQGEKVTLTSDCPYYDIFLGHCQNIRIEGLTFTNSAGGTAINICNFDQSQPQTSDIVVTNCRFIDSSPGIICRDVIESGPDKKFGNMEISNNVFMASNPSNKIGMGIDMQECRAQDGCYTRVFNNVIINAAYSLYMFGRSENLLFYNNTMLDTYDEVNYCGQYDIYQTQGDYNKTAFPKASISYNCVFKNNIFTKPIYTQSQLDGTLISGAKNNVFDDNVYDSSSMKDYVTYNNGGDGQKLTFGEFQAFGSHFEAHGRYAPVNFIDRESDARLSGPDNQAITAATDSIASGVSAPAADINGTKRTAEAGAYAFDPNLVFVGRNAGAGDGTYGNPYPSVSDAVKSGKTNIQIKAGTYNEDGLSVPAGFTVAPYSGNGKVVINGSVTFSGSQGGATTARNLSFAGKVTVNGQSVSLTGCIFASQVEAAGAKNITVEDSQFPASGAAGVVLTGTAGAGIFNNIFTGRTTGISVGSGSTGNLIYNNTFTGDSVNDAAIASDAAGNTFKNDIFSTENAIGDGGNTFAYNCYNSAALSGAYLDGISETGCVKADPQFINQKAGDFRLYKKSSCIGKGITDDSTPSSDFDGNGRGVPGDIGAYAYVDVDNAYYVSQTGGSDGNAGTKDAPFKTIGQAIQTVREGEKIYVDAGTYSENLTVSGKGDSSSAENSFLIRNLNGAQVTVDGTVTVSSSCGVTLNGINVAAGSDTAVTVADSARTDISNASLTGSVGIAATGSKDLSVSVVKITDAATGVSLDGASLSITRAKIKGASSAAVKADNGSSLKLTSSVIMNCAEGVAAAGESALAVLNNTFYNNAGLNIDVTQSAESTKLSLYNNIYSRPQKNQGAFIRISKASGYSSDHNIYDADSSGIIGIINGENKDLSDMQNGVSIDKSSFAADPLFKNAAAENFAPAKGSPAARKGGNVDGVPSADYTGYPFATVIDIGAYYSPYTLRTIYVAGENMAWSTGDGTYDAPYQKLKQALAVAQPTDTIVIFEGIYNEGRIDLADYHGVDDGRIYIIGDSDPNEWYNSAYHDYNKENSYLNSITRPVFIGKTDYDNVKVNASTDLFMKLSDCSYITIQGIDIAGFTDAGIWCEGCDNVTLSDIRMWNIDHQDISNSGVEGVLANGITNCDFNNLTIWDIGQTRQSQADHGMYIGGADDCTFENIVVHTVPGGGIQFYHGDNYDVHAKDITVKNCVFSSCKYGLIICGVQNSLFTNNTFHDNSEDDLYLDWNVQNNIFQNNLFYNDCAISERVNPTVVARHSGSGESKVINNTFRNCIYDYKYFPAKAQEGWGQKTDLSRFISSMNSQGLNAFTDFKAGDAGFVDGVVDKTATADQQAMQIRNGLFRIMRTSGCVDAGTADQAPGVDINGKARTEIPDIGAYEYDADAKEVILSSHTIAENDAAGTKIADLSVSGVEGSGSFELIPGEGSDDNGCFTISGNQLFAARSFDYETKSQYKILIKGTVNGTDYTRACMIQIGNVNETPKADGTVNYINTPITIDGDLSEPAWNNQLHDLTVADAANGREFAAKFGMLADKNNLYLSAKVTDDELSNDCGVKDFAADMVEVYLDGLNTEQATYDDSTAQLQFRWDDSTVYVYGNYGDFSNVAFKMKKVDGGYQFEAGIPWSDLGVSFDPKRTIGIAADVQDYDSSTDNTGTLAMVPVNNFWEYKDEYLTYAFNDCVAPVTTASAGGTLCNGWYSSDATVSLSAADDFTGVARTEYKIGDAQDWTQYTQPIVISREGITKVQYRSADKAGNVEDVQCLTVSVDKSMPSCSLTAGGKTISDGSSFDDCNPLQFSASDSLSGLSSASITVDGTAYSLDSQNGVTVDLAGKPGDHSVEIKASDRAGNVLEEKLTVKVTTSVRSMETLLGRYSKSGDLRFPLSKILENDIRMAEIHAVFGKTGSYAHFLNDFRRHLNNCHMNGFVSSNARTVLNADASYLLNIR